MYVPGAPPLPPAPCVAAFGRKRHQRKSPLARASLPAGAPLARVPSCGWRDGSKPRRGAPETTKPARGRLCLIKHLLDVSRNTAGSSQSLADTGQQLRTARLSRLPYSLVDHLLHMINGLNPWIAVVNIAVMRDEWMLTSPDNASSIMRNLGLHGCNAHHDDVRLVSIAIQAGWTEGYRKKVLEICRPRGNQQASALFATPGHFKQTPR